MYDVALSQSTLIPGRCAIINPHVPARHPRERTLFGREHEQEFLHTCFAQAVAGFGNLVLVSGEAGIGKTALVNALVQQAGEHGALVLTGHCYDLTTTPPYGPWIEMLQGYSADERLPALHPRLHDEAGRRAIASQSTFFEQVCALLTAASEQQPLLLILEDLHWTDPATLELLRFLGRQLAALRILIIATYRDDEIVRGHPLYQIAPALVRECNARRLNVSRFRRLATHAYVAGHYRLSNADETRLVEYLQHLTGGNPFFIEELLHTLEAEQLLCEADDRWSLAALDNIHVPSLIQQVVDSRLRRLDEPAIGLLEVAAVIGEDVPVDLWARVGGQSREDLSAVIERVIESRVMEESTEVGRLRFRHALVRQALYERLVSLRRQIQHGRVAEALVESPRPEPDTVAYHFQQASDPRAVAWLIEAGKRAQSLYAPHAAIKRLNAAFTLADSLSIVPPLHAYRARGVAHETIGDFESARADYLTALQMARDTGERHAEWQALIDLGMLWAERDYNRAGEYFSMALEGARDLDDRTTLAHSLNRMGNWHLNVEQPAEAAECHEEALHLFQEIDDRAGIAATLDLLGMTSYLSGDLIRGTGHFTQAVQLFTELGDRHGLASSLGALTMRSATYQTSSMVPAPDSLARSALDGEQSLELARDIGWRAGEAYALWMLTFSYGSQGDYGRALEMGHMSLGIAEAIEHRQWMAAARFTLGGLYLDLLALEPAREHLEQALEMAHLTGSVHWIRASSGFLASTCIAQGDLDRAQIVLDEALTPSVPAQTLGQRLAWCGRVELALARNRADAALEAIEHMTASTPNISSNTVAPRLSALYGEAFLAKKRFAEAESVLLATQSAAREQSAFPILWRIQLHLGKLYSQRSDSQRASLMFASAREVIGDLATQIPDEELRGNYLDSALGQVPQALRLTSLQEAKLKYDGLTARQRDVASLIAQGKANREIAEQLSLSERTVESHVSHILTTLDVNFRSQIAVWAVEKGLIDTR